MTTPHNNPLNVLIIIMVNTKTYPIVSSIVLDDDIVLYIFLFIM